MRLEHKVQPVKKNHSIKEVVISLFLQNPILKPERFEKLISSGYKDSFQQFDRISQFQVQFQKKTEGGKSASLKHEQNAGFKFISFKNGQVNRLLQGINETHRTFISYHNLDYERWNSFYEDYKKNITLLSDIQSDIFIKAFSLHYIDELIWIDDDCPIDLTLLLKGNREKIPGDFFKSENPSFSIVSEKQIQDAIYFDRLEIRVNPTIIPSLVISHNVTEDLDEEILLDQLFQSDFEQKIEDMHSYNKELLNSILQEEVQSLIGLTQNTKK
ncbi:TIGR04255 family protein [Membranihabitans maritimus]|uniref:TIGR04255 family protein n=1 Tax=Membranihabitans maritimus TaxID=2904244 RepID=UPI001F2FC805|nr:TIGR04255 family protein [Membranihabitans maritimus]